MLGIPQTAASPERLNKTRRTQSLGYGGFCSINFQENICQGGFHPKVKSPKNWKLVKL